MRKFLVVRCIAYMMILIMSSIGLAHFAATLLILQVLGSKDVHEVAIITALSLIGILFSSLMMALEAPALFDYD